MDDYFFRPYAAYVFIVPFQNKLKRIGGDAELRRLSIVFRIAINPVFKGAAVSKLDKQEVNKTVCKILFISFVSPMFTVNT